MYKFPKHFCQLLVTHGSDAVGFGHGCLKQPVYVNTEGIGYPGKGFVFRLP
jgi:hypothetical protein